MSNTPQNDPTAMTSEESTVLSRLGFSQDLIAAAEGPLQPSDQTEAEEEIRAMRRVQSDFPELTIVRFIGQGTTAQVYEIIDPVSQERVALKIPAEDLPEKQRLIAWRRLLLEQKLIERLGPSNSQVLPTSSRLFEGEKAMGIIVELVPNSFEEKLTSRAGRFSRE